MSGAKFTPAPGLDALVARMIVRDVQDVVRETESEAKRQAPDTKTWITRRDAFVRRTHRAVDGKEIPENLRFKLTAYEWDLQHPGAIPVATRNRGGHSTTDSALGAGSSYLREPRDPSQGHYVQIVHCRCELARTPNGVAKWVSSTVAKAVGTKVSGVVYAEHELIIPTEYGDVYPGGMIAPPTLFMHRTVGIMAARLRA